MKRITSLILCLSLVLSLCVTGAWAAETNTAPQNICSTQAWQVLKLTNKQRLANGLLPLSTFGLIQQAVDVRVSEVTKRFSHMRPDGTDPYTALTQVGLSYSSSGENIAAGQTSPSSVMNAWMNSDGHKQNILDPVYTHVGIGYTNKPCTIVTETGVGQISHGWVQLFMNKDCRFTAITPSQTSLTIEDGSTLEELDLYLTLTCSVHGDCYMPLLDQMCQGYDPTVTGAQTATVKYDMLTAQIKINHSSSDNSGSSGGIVFPGIGGNTGGTGGGSTRPPTGGSSSGSDTSTPTVTNAPDLSDASDWAVNWINQAHGHALLSDINLSGYSKDVTRLQLADLAVCLAEQLTGKTISPAADSSFTDTKELSILKAKAAGIAAGYEVNGKYEFRAQNPITREEICVMLAHVDDYIKANGGKGLTDNTTQIKADFLDRSAVADWAVKQVALMTNNSIMGGKATDTGNAIAPKDNTTLQEAVTLAVKLFDKN